MIFTPSKKHVRRIMKTLLENEVEGILLVDKPKGCTSFSLVRKLRKVLNVRKIGHAGTLDPFATGLMVLLIGRKYTRMSDQFLGSDKEYIAEVKLGEATNSYDCDGEVTSQSDKVPSEEEVHAAIRKYQGNILQIPPMFSALKRNGKKLCDLARAGKEIEREPRPVWVETTLLSYEYPFLHIRVRCSKGTYIRCIGHDLGQDLDCGAHLSNLRRMQSGSFCIDHAVDGALEDREAICRALRQEP